MAPVTVDVGARVTTSAAEEARRRMLEWPNPVEFVNNMYGCHPGEGSDYFQAVFGGLKKES